MQRSSKATCSVYTDNGTFFGLGNDTIIKMLLRDRTYEPHLVEAFKLLVREGDNVIDIGASIGYHSILLSNLVGQSGSVVAYEPQGLIFNYLCANIVVNSCFNIKAINKAVGNSLENIALVPVDYDDPSLNSGCQRIGSGGEIVEQITLDSIRSIVKPSFIKIDAQGAEPFILAGGISTLTTQPRPIICFEVEDIWLRALGSNTEQLLNMLLSLRYIILRIRSEYPCDHLAIPLERWESSRTLLQIYNYQYDLIFGLSVSVDLVDNNLYSSYTTIPF